MRLITVAIPTGSRPGSALLLNWRPSARMASAVIGSFPAVKNWTIRQLAAAHARGSPDGFSNSVNHCTPVSLSAIVVNLWSILNVPSIVVSARVATYSVAPRSRPAQPNDPLRPPEETCAAHANPGSGTSETAARSTFALDSHPAFRKRVAVPPSKSVANRELILSALAKGRSRLDLGPMDPGDDVRTMVGALGALGYRVDWDGGEITVHGGSSLSGRAGAVVDAHDAGTVARFATALAVLGSGFVTITGSPRLRERPMAPLIRALRSLGATP